MLHIYLLGTDMLCLFEYEILCARARRNEQYLNYIKIEQDFLSVWCVNKQSKQVNTRYSFLNMEIKYSIVTSLCSQLL
jgi:hypothetical protein